MIARIFTVIGFAMLAIPMGAVGVWLQDRGTPTIILHAEAIDQPVTRGGILKIQYRVRRYRSCEIIVDRVMYDAAGVRYALEDRNFLAAPGPLGDDTYIVAVNLPSTFAVGQGRYRATTRYHCNPLHGWWPILVTAPDILFTVSPSPAVPAPLAGPTGPRGPKGEQGNPGTDAPR